MFGLECGPLPITDPMPTPTISVVLPFHNAETTLDETLDSIATQTLGDYELVAVDDGSTDGSAALVTARAERDPRIRLLQPGRVGFVGAVNRGLGAARAPLVARMDADDRMLPARLERQVRLHESDPTLTLTGCRVRLFPEAAVAAGMREYVRWQNACVEPEAIAGEAYVELPVAHPTMCYRRDAVLDIGGYREGPFPEDYDLFLRLHAGGHRMAKVPDVLLEWREAPDRLSRTDPRCTREAFDCLRAAYLAEDPRLHQGRPLAFWGAGRRTRRRADRLLQYGFTPTAWVDIDPAKVGRSLQGAPVVAPDWLGRRPRPFVLSYVASHGARERIAAFLEGRGYRRGRDYLMVG